MSKCKCTEGKIKKIFKKGFIFLRNNKEKIDVKCLFCDHIWTTYLDNLLYRNSSKCPECYRKKITLSEDKINSLLDNRPIKLVDKYKGCIRIKHNWFCKKCNKKWKASISSVCYAKTGCPNCLKLNKEIINNRLSSRQIKITGMYTNSQNKTEFTCIKCNNVWNAYPNNILNGRGCTKCLKNSIAERAKIHLSKKNISLVEDYSKWNERVLLKCNKCGRTWENSIGKVKGCVSCSTPKNEKLTGKFLQEIFPNEKIEHNKKINYEKSYFMVDYYLTVNGIKHIVEYNGQQHYVPTRFWHMDEKNAKIKFSKQRKRDRKLRKYCKSNNTTLIEIDGRKYTNEKIITYLKSVLPITQTATGIFIDSKGL